MNKNEWRIAIRTFLITFPVVLALMCAYAVFYSNASPLDTFPDNSALEPIPPVLDNWDNFPELDVPDMLGEPSGDELQEPEETGDEEQEATPGVIDPDGGELPQEQEEGKPLNVEDNEPVTEDNTEEVNKRLALIDYSLRTCIQKRLRSVATWEIIDIFSADLVVIS